MPFLDKQVEILNTKLVGALFSHQRFSGGVIHGLAEKVVESRDEAADVQYPAVYNNQDEPEKVLLDDTYPLIVYHRALSVDTERFLIEFGDDPKEVLQTANMVMIVTGKRGVLKMSGSKFLGLLILALPTNIEKAALAGSFLDTLTVDFGGSELEPLTVFGEEYTGVDFRIPPESFLFKINYSMVSQYRKDCVEICDCLDTLGQ